MDLLEEQGVQLDEPYTRQLDGKLRELRFYLDRDQMRITYWISPGRRIILLTVFRKTQTRIVRSSGRGALWPSVSTGGIRSRTRRVCGEWTKQLERDPRAADGGARRQRSL
ncbi:type II toxin-antitoxin system RelE/ParE family toxin [Actinopolymorpha sp. NPDC004070]|uniref:type II toxin-antitoxin system RelE/ParE family toxin n=1 Tax=Actinopolymorpha sp. NPDC004070 TaxID=3154548 RepID=UPI0033A608F4